MMDFGSDLARRAEPRLWRGALLSGLGAVAEAAPLGMATGAVGSVITDEFAVYTEIVTHVWSLVDR